MMHGHNVLGFLALALFLAACGGGSKSANPSSATGTSGTAAATQTPGRADLTAAATLSTAIAEITATAIASPLKLTSSAFTDGDAIPAKYGCSGAKVSPPLAWTGAPPNTQEYALILSDPDVPAVGGLTHWVVYGIPASITSLPEAVPAGPDIAGGGQQGPNVSSVPAFSPFCPPIGAKAHHYDFHLYALDAPLSLPPETSRADLEAAVQSHITAEATLVGLFSR